MDKWTISWDFGAQRSSECPDESMQMHILASDFTLAYSKYMNKMKTQIKI